MVDAKGGVDDEDAAARRACEEKMLNAVEDLVATHFPLKSTEQDKHCAREGAYLTLLSEALQVVVRGGALPLLARLKGQLREASQHRYVSLIHKSLHAFCVQVCALTRDLCSRRRRRRWY